MSVTPQVSYPGVYIQEVLGGVRTIAGVATSIAAFVGYTARGPVNKAVSISSFADFERTFGGLERNSEISYAARHFFLNGGTYAYIVRVAKDAAVAEVTLKDPEDHKVLVASAKSHGTWGNNIRLSIDYATTNPDSTFNLAVTPCDENGKPIAGESERHLNLSMNSHSSRYAKNVVNSASKLINLEPAAGLTFDNNRGYSLSRDMGTAFPLNDQDMTIAGVLDGVDPFKLTLKNPAGFNNLSELVTALKASISLVPLTTRLDVTRANALGKDDPAGNFLKLTSLRVLTNPNTEPEFSSVQIVTAPEKLGLGLDNGGREKTGASFRRPSPNGTTSVDLADIFGTPSVAEDMNIKIDDCSTHPAAAILPSTPLPLPATTVGPELAKALQALIRGIDNSATQQARVQLTGTFLQVVPSAATPNASITFSNGGKMAARLAGPGSVVNVQEYSLGTGAPFGAQTDAAPGANGIQPDADAIIGKDAEKTGIYALRDVDLFNLMAIPFTTQLTYVEAKSVLATAITFCEERRAFFIVDSDPTKALTDISDWAAEVSTSRNAGIFFPRVQAADPLDDFRLRSMPASGAIAGVFARTDSQRGVWKAPAGTDAGLVGVQGLDYNLTDLENGSLNQKGVNCLRTFPTYGFVVWGARTMRGDDQHADEYKYIPVRRLALYIEESLYRGTKWVVFEPNDEPLWAQIRLNVGAFMQTLFRQGAFQGKTPQEAYFVKCDKETTTQDDINRGIVNILVGFAPLKPAEFVVIKISQMAGQIRT